MGGGATRGKYFSSLVSFLCRRFLLAALTRFVNVLHPNFASSNLSPPTQWPQFPCTDWCKCLTCTSCWDVKCLHLYCKRAQVFLFVLLVFFSVTFWNLSLKYWQMSNSAATAEFYQWLSKHDLCAVWLYAGMHRFTCTVSFNYLLRARAFPANWMCACTCTNACQTLVHCTRVHAFKYGCLII